MSTLTTAGNGGRAEETSRHDPPAPAPARSWVSPVRVLTAYVALHGFGTLYALLGWGPL